MSTKVPVVTAKVLEGVLIYLGFVKMRQSGSHVFYRHPDGRYTTLPHHGNQDLSRYLTRAFAVNFFYMKTLPAILLISLLLPLACSGGSEGAREREGEGVSGRVGEEARGRVGTLETVNNTMDITKDMLLGRVDPAGSEDFVLIDSRYAGRAGMYMRHEAMDAFLAMHAAAQADGIDLKIISAMRTFIHQKRIWEDKWQGRQMLYGNIRATDIPNARARALEILRFSSMPGTSRHHWGTDIDLNSLDNAWFASGTGRKVYDWLRANAGRFGFCQPYTAIGTGRQGGYEEEKWHWSYEPLSRQYLRAYQQSISYEDIKGFDGWETAAQIGVIEGYVMEVGCGR